MLGIILIFSGRCFGGQCVGFCQQKEMIPCICSPGKYICIQKVSFPTDELFLLTDWLSPLINELSPLVDGVSLLTDGLSPLTDELSLLTDGLTPLTDGLFPQ